MIKTAYINIEVLEKIEELVGDGKLYPSRSELFRAAIRVFIIHEIRKHKIPRKEVREVLKQMDEIDHANKSSHVINVEEDDIKEEDEMEHLKKLCREAMNPKPDVKTSKINETKPFYNKNYKIF